MGYYKEHLLEMEERGFGFIGDKHVCGGCFNDDAIKEFIKKNAEEKKCDYCGRKTKINMSIHIDKVIDFIVDGLKSEWDNPVNCVGWENGWVGAKIISTYDLFCELDFISNRKVFDELVNVSTGQEWCEIDPYGLREHEKDFYNWKAFSELVKHHVRYFFHRVTKSNQDDDFYQKPFKILNHIGKTIKVLGLIKRLKKDAELFRVLTHNNLNVPKKVEDLGPPPFEKAIYSNRMSPAGIPMFYGAMDEKTAILETSDKNNNCKTLAHFKLLKEIYVLDLTFIPEIPSLFSQEKRHLRSPILFLKNFVNDLSKPVKKDNKENIEYIPTQIATEYFRHILNLNRKNKIMGIKYPSSRNPQGISCVLFIQQKDCTDKKNEPDKILYLIDSKQIK